VSTYLYQYTVKDSAQVCLHLSISISDFAVVHGVATVTTLGFSGLCLALSGRLCHLQDKPR